MEPATGAEPLGNLLRRCRDGDASGFTEAYRRFGRSLYGTALRLMGRPEEAEDAVQEAFLNFYRQVPEIPPERLPAWLHRVVANGCIDRLRRTRRWRFAALEERWGSGDSRPEGLGLDLRVAVKRLPPRAREVFLLHDVEGFTHEEIGRMMDLSTGATKSQLFRARGLLRRHLGGRRRGRETTP